MSITDLLKSNGDYHRFSIEVLPPLRGNGTDSLYKSLDKLMVYRPLYINITNHQSEWVFQEQDDGHYERHLVRRRPGSLAIAAAIQQRYQVPVMPHIICSGASRGQIEEELIDLQILNIQNVLLLRGDKAKEDRVFTPVPNGHYHTTELIEQVNRFNDGFFWDGTPIRHPGPKFHYGVACYPEKHEEAPNMEMDMRYLRMKQDLGAECAVTQLFYDNRKFFAFLERARQMGITMPIIPGIKPFSKLSQLSVVPRTFHCDLPQALAEEAVKCKTDEEAKQLGIEWTTAQCKELYGRGVHDIHFYTVSAVDSVCEICKRLL